MNYGNGFFYLAEIGYFRLAQNGRFHPALTYYILMVECAATRRISRPPIIERYELRGNLDYL